MNYQMAMAALDAAQRRRFLAASGPPPQSGFMQVTPLTGTLRTPSASVSAIASALAAAQPGDHIRIPPGTYNSVNWDVPNGTVGAAPIAVYPADKNNPPIFTGSNNYLSGDNVYWLAFDVRSTSTGRDTRSIRCRNSNGSFWLYFEYQHDEQICHELAGNVTNCTIQHAFFKGSGKTSSESIGGSAFKMGESGNAGDARGNALVLSRLQNFINQRETGSIKEGDATVSGVTAVNCHDLVVRHGTAALFELINGFRYIVAQGPDHVLRDCLPTNRIIVPPGSRNGDIDPPYSSVPTGSGSVYLSAHNQLVESCPGIVDVGNNSQSYGDGQADSWRPTSTKIAPIAGQTQILTPNGDPYSTVTASQAARTIPTIAAEHVGLAAYRAQVENAP